MDEFRAVVYMVYVFAMCCPQIVTIDPASVLPTYYHHYQSLPHVLPICYPHLVPMYYQNCQCLHIAVIAIVLLIFDTHVLSRLTLSCPDMVIPTSVLNAYCQISLWIPTAYDMVMCECVTKLLGR